MKHIPIDKEKIPYRARYKLAGKTFVFTFNYNAQGDFFTVDLHKDGETLVLGEKIVYEQPLFGSVADGRFPRAALIPFDPSGSETDVNWNSLGRGVYLFVYTEDMLPETEETETKQEKLKITI